MFPLLGCKTHMQECFFSGVQGPTQDSLLQANASGESHGFMIEQDRERRVQNHRHHIYVYTHTIEIYIVSYYTVVLLYYVILHYIILYYII